MGVSQQKKDKDQRIRAFSEKYGVDYGGWIFRWDLYETGDGHGYEPSYPIEDVLDQLSITEQDRIVDLGCGKGYAMYLLSNYKFSAIDGVEMDKKLSQIANNNISIMFPKCSRYNVYNADVNLWNGYNDYNYFYMCNPFGRETSIHVAKKIIEMVETTGKEATVIYQMGEFIDEFVELGYKVILNTEKNCVMRYSI